MAYTKQTWVARAGTFLNRFTKSNESPTSVELVNAPGTLTEPGTPFSVARMNYMEDGIEAAAAVADLAAASTVSFKNKLINGDFREKLWQRGTSLAVTTGQSKYLADRWRHDLAGTSAASTYSRQAFTLGQTAVPGEPGYFARIALTNGGDATNGKALLAQYIENVRTLAGRKATLTFWAKADAVKSLSVEAVQSFGSGGSPSADVSTPVQKVSLSTSWQKFTLTFDVPSITGKTIGTDGDVTSALAIRFWMSASSAFATPTGTLGVQTGNFDFALVQIEEGQLATSFEQRAEAVEKVLSQRYFERNGVESGLLTANPGGYHMHSGTARADGSVYFTIPYKVTKRKTPTFTPYNLVGGQNLEYAYSGGAAQVAATVDSQSENSINIKAVLGIGAWVACTLYCYWSADAEF